MDSREGMQDVAAVLWRRIEDITSMDDFRRRAFGVARFVAMEFLRTRRRDRRVFGDDALRLLAVASERGGRGSARRPRSVSETGGDRRFFSHAKPCKKHDELTLSLYPQGPDRLYATRELRVMKRDPAGVREGLVHAGHRGS